MYLVWFDDTTKKTTQEKIDEAIERFQDRFGFAPDHCLVSESHAVEHPHVEVRPVRYVRPGYFQVGAEDETMARALAARALMPAEAMAPLDLAGDTRTARGPRMMISATALAAMPLPKTAPVAKPAPRAKTAIAEPAPAPVAEQPAPRKKAAVEAPVALPEPAPVLVADKPASRKKAVVAEPAPVVLQEAAPVVEKPVSRKKAVAEVAPAPAPVAPKPAPTPRQKAVAEAPTPVPVAPKPPARTKAMAAAAPRQVSMFGDDFGAPVGVESDVKATVEQAAPRRATRTKAEGTPLRRAS
jgi:hypothetical protein